MRVVIYGTLNMSALNFTEKPSTNHILWNKSRVTNNDAAENFLVWFQQNSLQVGLEEEADKDIFSLSQDSKTSYHLLLSYAELPTNVLDSKQEQKNRLTGYKTDSKWKENQWRFVDESFLGS